MFCDARRGRDQLEQIVAPVHRFHRAEAQTRDLGLIQQPADQVHQPRGASRLASPAAQINTAQHDLAVAPGEIPHLGDYLFDRRAAAAAAYERDDAERTAIVAAVLDLEIGARS